MAGNGLQPRLGGSNPIVCWNGKCRLQQALRVYILRAFGTAVRKGEGAWPHGK